jgi:hypothetical protein
MPAGPRTLTESSPGPLPPADLIAFLQRTQLSCTQGYDVVSILAADRVNELFGQEYVARTAAGEAFAPVTGRVAISGNQYASFSGLTLGQPLISFSPGAQPQEADLRIEFLSGTVTTEQVDNEVTTVLSTQHVQPGSGFVLTGVVPLVDVQGETDPNTHEVRLDITNASDFAAHMNIPGAAARTALGQFFLSLMQQEAGAWAYVLGSLNYSADPGMKLVPTSFEIATQVDSADPADTGRVLLFITTAYGTAPPGRPAAMQLPNMVPAGSTTTLIIANRVLLGGLVLDAIKSRLGPFGATVAASPVDKGIPGSLYTLTTEGGSINLGQVKNGPGSWGLYVYYSGTASNDGNGLPVLPGNVVIPLSGIAVVAGGDGLNTTAHLPWTQQWASEFEGGGKYNYAVSGTMPMYVSMTGQQAATVDASGTINFGAPPPVAVSFQADTSFWKGSSANATAAIIQSAAQERLQPILSIQLPAVQTFAVNNLLFPAEHNVHFSSAHVPGDLVTFGDLATSAVTVEPLYATLTPGQTCRFSASDPGGSAVHWTLGEDGAGSIDANGDYLAPDVVPVTTHDVVTAWTTAGGARQTASAVVTLVPAGLSVSPDYVVMVPGAAPQQFVASAAGQTPADIQWSLIEPPGSGTVAGGLYTPPAHLSAIQAVTVRATRNSDSTTADALLILTPNPPEGVQISPPMLASPLAAGKSQQFTATVAGAKWSVLPAIGTITPTGLYTAPANVATTTTVAVVATVYPPFVFGLATLQVAPNPPAADPDQSTATSTLPSDYRQNELG